jgi:uncharacterized membrane protein
MKDFIKVFILLVMVFGSVALLIWMGYVLGYWGMVFLSVVIATAIIIFVIKKLPSRRPPNGNE